MNRCAEPALQHDHRRLTIGQLHFVHLRRRERHCHVDENFPGFFRIFDEIPAVGINDELGGRIFQIGNAVEPFDALMDEMGGKRDLVR